MQWGVDSKLRILAADDNNKVLDLLDKDLSALGLSVSTDFLDGIWYLNVAKL